MAGSSDGQEGVTTDLGPIGRGFCASSWTECTGEDAESSFFWEEYATVEAGVRITLPPWVFNHIPNTQDPELSRAMRTIVVEVEKISYTQDNRPSVVTDGLVASTSIFTELAP